MALKDIAEEILKLTDGGLDIILEFYPHATTTKNFAIRHDDKNASTSLYNKDKHGNLTDRWRINDFGGNMKSQDCFGVYAMENNCDYWEAIVRIAEKIQVEKGVQLLESNKQVFKYDYREWKVE